MANEKVSAFPSADPLTGNEEVPLIQAGANVRSTVASLVSAGIVEPVVTFGGTWPSPLDPPLVIPPQWVWVNGEMESEVGCWVYDLTYDVAVTATSLTFDNLAGASASSFVSPALGAASIDDSIGNSYDVSAPALGVVFGVIEFGDVINVDLGALRVCTGDIVLRGKDLTSIDISSLTWATSLKFRAGDNAGTNSPPITSFVWPPNLNFIVLNVEMVQLQLDQATVDAILEGLVALDGSGTTQMWGGNEFLTVSCNLADSYNKAPSAAGLAAKATLEARPGVTSINVNPEGAITNWTISGGGADYAEGDTGTVDGGAPDATYTVGSVDGLGAVTSIYFGSAQPAVSSANGEGYAPATGVTTTPDSGIGSGLELNITRTT